MTFIVRIGRQQSKPLGVIVTDALERMGLGPAKATLVDVGALSKAAGPQATSAPAQALPLMDAPDAPATTSSRLAETYIDLDTLGPPPPLHSRWLRVTYDGDTGIGRLSAELSNGRMPIIEVVDGHTGTVLARGEPCANEAATSQAAIGFAFSRVPVLIKKALRRPENFALPAIEHSPPAPQTATARRRLKAAAFEGVRSLYRMTTRAPHWVIGYRFNRGASVWDRQSLDGEPWRVLADTGCRFYADPFPIVEDGRVYLFFEDLPHATGKGLISMVEITPDGPVGPVTPVLEEPHHLSYPHLVRDGGTIYMIPESGASGEVVLYRAIRFPDLWEKAATLVDGIEGGDATVIQFDGRWWMFLTVRYGEGSTSDMLAIYHAPALVGPWRPHAENPVLIDQTQARPAGDMIIRNGRLWRPVQNCRHGYGTGLGLAEVTVLDENSFDQTVRTQLWPSKAWPGRKLHTLNQVQTRHGLLECIDGSDISPRSRLIASMMPNRRGRHADVRT